MENIYFHIKHIFLFLPLILLCLNFYGIFAKKVFKKKLFVKTNKGLNGDKGYDWALNFCDFETLVKKIHENIVHFQRENKNYCPIYENYILFMLSFLPINHFKNYEFYNIKRIISVGYGLCSQVCILLYLCLKKKNINSKIVGFKGHVLVHVTANKQDFLLDPDYGVVLNFHPTDVKRNIHRILADYKKKIGEDRIKQLKCVFKSNYEYIPEKVIKRNIILENICYLLKWLMPFIIFFLIKIN